MNHRMLQGRRALVTGSTQGQPVGCLRHDAAGAAGDGAARLRPRGQHASAGSRESGGVTVNCVCPGWTETAISQPQIGGRTAP